jgi:hypothetical protein
VNALRRVLPLLVLLAAAFGAKYFVGTSGPVAFEAITGADTATGSASAAPATTPEPWGAGQLITGRGTVTRLLADDNEGSRHQRFVLELPSGRTLLVAHNIDLAPRIDALAVGDAVAFRGEYEPNDRGGVLHWTHHDPAGRHPGGWLRHRDRRYE